MCTQERSNGIRVPPAAFQTGLAGETMMGRLRCAALSVLALTVMCPATFAAEPAPATASDVPVQTGSIGGADAAIGAAARKLHR